MEVKARGNRKDQPLERHLLGSWLKPPQTPTAPPEHYLAFTLKQNYFHKPGPRPGQRGAKRKVSRGPRKPELLRPKTSPLYSRSTDLVFTPTEGASISGTFTVAMETAGASGFSPHPASPFRLLSSCLKCKTSYPAHRSTFCFSAVKAHEARVQLDPGAFSCNATSFWKRECPLIVLKMSNSHHAAAIFKCNAVMVRQAVFL